MPFRRPAANSAARSSQLLTALTFGPSDN